MNIFISWSGERSKSVASALRSLLRSVNQDWNPWLSHVDIAVGAQWRGELKRGLGSADYGIVCLSASGLRSPWVLFETGALSVSMESKCVCPYLIDIRAEILNGPLAEFQSCEANREGTFNLLTSLRRFRDCKNLTETELEYFFDQHWPEFEEQIRMAPKELHVPEQNNLDEVALLNLLRIHFGASSNRLMHVIEQTLNELESDPDQFNFEMLLVNAKRVIDEGRLLLTPFYSNIVGDVLLFLEDCLPTHALETRLGRGIEIVLKYKDPTKRRKAAYQLIQEEQANLMRVIQERLNRHLSGRANGRR